MKSKIFLYLAGYCGSYMGIVLIFSCDYHGLIDGSPMVSYSADSHWLYGELYFLPDAAETGEHASDC